MSICDELTGETSHVGHRTGDDGSGGEGTEELGLSSQGGSVELSDKKTKKKHMLRGNETALKDIEDRRTASYDGRVDGESRRLESCYGNAGRRNGRGGRGGLGCSRLSSGDLRTAHL